MSIDGFKKKLDGYIDKIINSLKTVNPIAIVNILNINTIRAINNAEYYSIMVDAYPKKFHYLKSLVLGRGYNPSMIDQNNLPDVDILIKAIDYIYIRYLEELTTINEDKKDDNNLDDLFETEYILSLLQVELGDTDQYDTRMNEFNHMINEILIEKYFINYDDIYNISNYLRNYFRNNMIKYRKELKEKYGPFIENRKIYDQGIITNAEYKLRVKELGNERDVVKYLDKMLLNISMIDIEILYKKYDKNIINCYLNLFTINLEDMGELCYYPSDSNKLDIFPLVKMNDDKIIIVDIPYMTMRIHDNIHYRLSKSDSRTREKYHKRKALFTENKAKEIFRRYYEEEEIYTNIYYNNKKGNLCEADMLIISTNIIIIVESKSHDMKEMIHVGANINAIKNDFKKGIKKAYKQGIRLKKEIESDRNIEIKDRKGNIILKNDDIKNKKIIIMVVTYKSYRAIATNINEILEIEGEEYPIVVGLMELDKYSIALKTRKDLEGYLKERDKVYGKLIAHDELEYVGYYAENKGLDIPEKREKTLLDPHWSDMFDDEFKEKHNIGDKSVGKKKKGSERNKPCKCGSGKKYKRCCGK